MLDDRNVIKQRDRANALDMAAAACEQVGFATHIEHHEHDGRVIQNIIIAGMGGAGLAADIVHQLIAGELTIPLETVKGYSLPRYASSSSLVILTSTSGNTEETLSCLNQATACGAQLAIVAAGGKLVEFARTADIAHATFPQMSQARMGMLYNLRAILTVLVAYRLVSRVVLDDMASSREWLEAEVQTWMKDMPLEHNYAKQLALQAAGKTALFMGSDVTACMAYKWKVSWNENAKNLAFHAQLPESNHNEFIGWTSHPVDKPFIIFDIRSELEHPRIAKRYELTDRLLSGMRPKAHEVWLKGDGLVRQVLWGCILSDFVSVYLGIINNADPTQVGLTETLKLELTQ